jgi:transposase
MLQITPKHQLFLALEPVNFKNGIDGLKSMCKKLWDSDPFGGQFFIFRNTRATDVKILTYDGNGFWLAQKRFSVGKLKWWPRTKEEATKIRPVELLVMLQQGNPLAVDAPVAWRKLPDSP